MKVIICAILVSAIAGSFADKFKDSLKKYTPQGRAGGPPLPFPPVPPFRLSPVTDQPHSVLDPYACLPKYICVIQDKKGEKRTTIIHGLHPALRKAKPNVIDPSTLPKLPGDKRPLSPSPYASDDEGFREREFDDSFLKQQEMAETMAIMEEKRRQFLYNQGILKQKIIPKGGENPEEEDEEKKSDESNEEEEEKSQENAQKIKEASEKSSEAESKEQAEEESTEEDEESSKESKSRSKLNKYKLKRDSPSNKKRNQSNAFKSRMDDYEDADMVDGQLVTVPWDDRIKNDSDPLNPKEIYDKLFRKVLPFQFPTLPKIARNIPGISFLAADSDEVTVTQRPGILKRMFKTVTGSGTVAESKPTEKRNVQPIMRRYKRNAEENLKLVSNDAKIVKLIRDPARQCRMIYKGCDLPYEHIMKMVSAGQVLIENENEASATKKPVPTVITDDEVEQALQDKMTQKKFKPIPQMLAQAHLNLGGKKKASESSSLSIFGNNKHTISLQRNKPKKQVASLPLLPMRYQWGKPTYTVHGKPFYSGGPSDFSGGIVSSSVSNKAPTQPTTKPTTTTTERPIFAASPLDKKTNYSIPYQHSIIKLNETHAVHVLKKKPYNPAKTRTRDAKGRPVSFSTVFTEIAGNTGGIHDFFDRISGAFGGDGVKESGRELTSTFPGSNTDVHGNPDSYSAHAKPTAFPSAPVPDHTKENDGNSAERDDEEDSDEEEEDDDEESNNDEEEEDGREGEEENNNDEEEAVENNEEEEAVENNNDDEEEEEEDIADDIGEGVVNTQGLQNPKEPLIGKPEPQQPLAFESKKPDQQHQSTKNKNKEQSQKEEEEEEDDEEVEGDDDDEEELDLPDTIPPFIRQSMIEEHKRKKIQKEQEQDGEEEEHQGELKQQGTGVGGRPPSGAPAAGFGRPIQGGAGGGLFGQQSHGPPQPSGGLFSFLG